MAFAATPAQSVIRRHDVADERYLRLGETFHPFVAQVLVPRSKVTALGIGTLFGREWVVTAAHLFRGAAATDKKPISIKIGGSKHAADRVILSPGWANGEEAPENDIALVHLASPVPTPGLACLYSGSDEMGKITSIAGYGLTGDGIQGPIASKERALRGATVKVTKITPRTIEWTFDAPAASDATALEGISGPGDSGGPALLDVEGQWCLAGVSSTQLSEEGREGMYGAHEIYARVSAHRD